LIVCFVDIDGIVDHRLLYWFDGQFCSL